MRLSLDEIKTAIAGLSEDERAELADYLLLTFDYEPVEAEWLKVAIERADEMSSGKVAGIPAARVLKKL